MRVIIRYKARMTWTDSNQVFHSNEMCDVTHEVEELANGDWKTINLEWNSLSIKVGRE